MKINQDLVTKTFMTRNGTCGSYWCKEDVNRIQKVLQETHGIFISESEAIDFWIWRSNEWDSSFLSVGGNDEILEFFTKFIQHIGVEENECDHVGEGCSCKCHEPYQLILHDHACCSPCSTCGFKESCACKQCKSIVKVNGSITPFPKRIGVLVLVKDDEGCTWEIELDPDYHTQLLQDIESQIPEKSEGGSIRYSLEYDPSKIWNARKLDSKETPE